MHIFSKIRFYTFYVIMKILPVIVLINLSIKQLIKFILEWLWLDYELLDYFVLNV